MTSDGFLEHKIDTPSAAREHNAFVLSLLPYEQTTTYKKGTRNGPDAIVDASGHMELTDEVYRISAADHGIHTLRPAISDLDSITAHVRETVRAYPNSLVGFIGGEHSVTPAIVAGLERDDIGVVWIDAHADLRDEFRGQPDNHACAGYHTQKIAPIVQVGIRSLAPEEIAFLSDGERVAVFREWCGNAKSAIRALPETVYISVDLDGLNPMLMRAVGTPEPGGLAWEEALDLLEFVFREKRVCAFDVVELCPSEDDVVSSYTAARLVYKIMTFHAIHRLGA